MCCTPCANDNFKVPIYTCIMYCFTTLHIWTDFKNVRLLFLRHFEGLLNYTTKNRYSYRIFQWKNDEMDRDHKDHQAWKSGENWISHTVFQPHFSVPFLLRVLHNFQPLWFTVRFFHKSSFTIWFCKGIRALQQQHYYYHLKRKPFTSTTTSPVRKKTVGVAVILGAQKMWARKLN